MSPPPRLFVIGMSTKIGARRCAAGDLRYRLGLARPSNDEQPFYERPLPAYSREATDQIGVGSATLMISLPILMPSKSMLTAVGVFSRPWTIVSLLFSLPSREVAPEI